MKEFKSLPPEDSLIRTISGVGGQGARLLPTPTVQSRRLRAAGLCPHLSPPVSKGSGHFLLCSVSWNLVLV